MALAVSKIPTPHIWLRRYILFTAIIGLSGYLSLSLFPTTTSIKENYTPLSQPLFTPLAARSLGAWFFLCGVLRLGAWWNWEERGWYDAAMVSLAVPVWHYAVERWVWGSVGWRQVVLAGGIDGGGLVWMGVVRGRVVGGRGKG